jgi:hypothetical protein
MIFHFLAKNQAHRRQQHQTELPSNATAWDTSCGRFLGPRLLNQPVFLKTEMALFCNNYMVEDAEPENLRRLGQLLVRAAVSRAGIRVSRWVIMDEDYGCGAVGDNIGENFSRLNRAIVEKADCHHTLLDYLVCAVEGNADEILQPFSGNVGNQGGKISWAMVILTVSLSKCRRASSKAERIYPALARPMPGTASR